MSALIRESHANETQPCWLSADAEVYGTPIDLIPGSGEAFPLLFPPDQPLGLLLVNYPTKAGKYYDISYSMTMNVISGSSTGQDIARVFVSVDPTIVPVSTIGACSNDYRIGAVSNTVFSAVVRLQCSADATVQIRVGGFQVGGSTAQYGGGCYAISISEFP